MQGQRYGLLQQYKRRISSVGCCGAADATDATDATDTTDTTAAAAAAVLVIISITHDRKVWRLLIPDTNLKIKLFWPKQIEYSPHVFLYMAEVVVVVVLGNDTNLIFYTPFTAWCNFYTHI